MHGSYLYRLKHYLLIMTIKFKQVFWILPGNLSRPTFQSSFQLFEKGNCYGMNIYLYPHLPDSYVKALTPNITYLRWRLWEIIRLRWWVWDSYDGISAGVRRDVRVCPLLGQHRAEALGAHSKGVASWEPRAEASREESFLGSPWPWTLKLLELWEINFCV